MDTADFPIDKRLPFTHSAGNSGVSIATFAKSIRQLLLQAFCGWHVFDQPSIYLKFVCGIYFTLIKFTRPHQLYPLPIRGCAVPTGETKVRGPSSQHFYNKGYHEYRNRAMGSQGCC